MALLAGQKELTFLSNGRSNMVGLWNYETGARWFNCHLQLWVCFGSSYAQWNAQSRFPHLHIKEVPAASNLRSDILPSIKLSPSLPCLVGSDEARQVRLERSLCRSVIALNLDTNEFASLLQVNQCLWKSNSCSAFGSFSQSTIRQRPCKCRRILNLGKPRSSLAVLRICTSY